MIKKLSLLLSVFVLSACGAGRDKTNVELIQDMMDQKNLKAQDYDRIKNEPSNRVPPAGTVPRGFSPYKYAGDAVKAEAQLVNPLQGAKFEASLKQGAEKYRIYCGLCHGVDGKGDGPIAEKMPLKPPPLISDKVKAFKDGRIFHIITDGQGVMSSYASQIQKTEDRWAIVNHIRTLQKR